MSRARSRLLKVYERVPAARPAMVAVNRAIKRPTFEGWGMSNHHALPWEDDPSWAHFEAAAREVREDFEHGAVEDTGITAATVDGLRWRHWVVSWAVRQAAAHAEGPLTLVECGVGDGLTAYFATHEAQHLGREHVLHAYDAWTGVTTSHGEGSYASLAVDRTRRNLRDRSVEYHVGFVPETFDETAPEVVHYLHLDLNAVPPTRAALEFFEPRLAPRAVVLFDDHGHAGYPDQRRLIDEFTRERPGSLLKMPTGQALWFP